MSQAKIFKDLESQSLISVLLSGEVGVLPTDTVYGLVCVAENKTAVEKLYSIKKRSDKRGTLIAASLNQLDKLGFDINYFEPVKNYWPGAISVVTPMDSSLDYLNNGLGTMAVRIPLNPAVQRLLEVTGPLLTTSANSPDQPVAANLSEAEAYFGDQIDFYVDGGDYSDRLPSTIIEIVDGNISIIRAGSVKIN